MQTKGVLKVLNFSSWLMPVQDVVFSLLSMRSHFVSIARIAAFSLPRVPAAAASVDRMIQYRHTVIRLITIGLIMSMTNLRRLQLLYLLTLCAVLTAAGLREDKCERISIDEYPYWH